MGRCKKQYEFESVHVQVVEIYIDTYKKTYIQTHKHMQTYMGIDTTFTFPSLLSIRNFHYLAGDESVIARCDAHNVEGRNTEPNKVKCVNKFSNINSVRMSGIKN